MSQSFHALGVSAPLCDVLARSGFNEPFAVQTLVLPDALLGVDILAESPTGSGKTLAFGLPLIERIAGAERRPSALVLVPTRELALQVTADLRPLAAAKRLRVDDRLRRHGDRPAGEAGGQADVLVATPGRLHDLVERRAVSLADVRILVLDEADRMLDMGFKPQVDRILRTVPTNRQTMLFSATFDGAVAELARAYTVTPTHVKADRPQAAEPGEIDHAFVPVTAEDKLDRLVEQLGVERRLALVFVRTKHGADKLARKLQRQHDIPAVAMHGNLSQNQRERALAQFESGRVSTLVATDVAARGLDVDDITHVINFDPPRVEDDYVHRVGRTGRAGRSGERRHPRPARPAGRGRPARRAARARRRVRGRRADGPGERRVRADGRRRPARGRRRRS